MSETEAKAFIARVGEHAALRAEVDALRGGDVLQRLVKLGAENGFQFTEEDYRQAVVSLADGELSEESLDEVLRETGLK